MTESDNKYELMVIVDMSIGQAKIDKRLESIRKQINKDGKIFFEDIWGERDLAYTIKKMDRGYYAVFNFTFDTAEMKEFETSLRLETEILRHLIVKLPLNYEPQSLEDLQNAHLEEKEAEKAEK